MRDIDEGYAQDNAQFWECTMTTIHAKWVGEEAILPKADFQRLLELARRSEEIHVCEPNDDLPTRAMMQVAEKGQAFDYWNEPGEDIYTKEDGDPV
jgi:hypothetical protein